MKNVHRKSQAGQGNQDKSSSTVKKNEAVRRRPSARGIGFDRYDLTDTSVWLHIKPILSVTSGKYIDTPLIQK